MSRSFYSSWSWKTWRKSTGLVMLNCRTWRQKSSTASIWWTGAGTNSSQVLACRGSFWAASSLAGLLDSSSVLKYFTDMLHISQAHVILCCHFSCCLPDLFFIGDWVGFFDITLNCCRFSLTDNDILLLGHATRCDAVGKSFSQWGWQ